MTRFLAASIWLGIAFAQVTFDAASVRRSEINRGVDARGQVAFGPNRVSAKNVTLKHLIATAYQVQHSQIAGGPRWLDSQEFDIEARMEAEVTRVQLRQMLQALLAERFHLVFRKETKDLRVHALVVDKNGFKTKQGGGGQHFHGDMRQLADLIAVQATIPAAVDPGRPAMAGGAPILVIDKTGLDGVYDFDLDLRPELGTDQFTLWQRVLREQLGLRLESQKAKVEVLVIDAADRIPGAN